MNNSSQNPDAKTPRGDRPYPPVTAQPSEQSAQAIADFVATGAWPQPGTMPVRFSFGKRY